MPNQGVPPLICPKCGHDNPQPYRFCGMCGAQLERRRTVAAEASKEEPRPTAPAAASSILGLATHEPPVPPKAETPKPEAPAPKTPPAAAPRREAPFIARERSVPIQPRPEERPPTARPPEREPARTPASRSSLAEKTAPAFIYEKKEPVRAPQPRPFIYDSNRSTAVSGPSFLGLGANYAEEPRRGRAAWFLLALIVIGALIGYQWWRAGWAMPEAAVPYWQRAKAFFQGQPSSPPSATVTPATPAPTADATPSPGKAGDTTGDSKAPPTNPNATTPQPPAANTDPKTSPQNDTNDENDATKPQPPASPQRSSVTRPAPAQTAAPEVAPADWDGPVALADNYLQARPQDCGRALQILRYAAEHGNPRAGSKLGGLYAAGVCVPQDNVTAYAWFSRALKLDPNNRRLSAARSVVWQQMSNEERGRAQ
jgi:zinc ribbon protein